MSARQALVTEKEGGLKRIDLETGAIYPVTGFPEDLDNVRRGDPRDNSGMFGIALASDFQRTRLVYVAYSAAVTSGTVLRVVRGVLEQNDALAGVQEVLIVRPASNERFHYGGALLFGADGKLYITAGERFLNEKDQPANPVAQDRTDARGKIYRVNPDGTIPNDNPNFGMGAVAGLYAMGIRASQGLALQPRTNRIWFSEHGARRGDEINILAAGANYGWPIRTTGAYRNEDYAPPTKVDSRFVEPVYSWADTVAPTGLAFYTGPDFPDWRGDLLVGGLSRGSLWRLRIGGVRVIGAHELFPDSRVRLRAVKQSLDGRIYLLTDEKEGRVIRIEAS